MHLFLEPDNLLTNQESLAKQMVGGYLKINGSNC